jgi:hypothetical protein
MARSKLTKTHWIAIAAVAATIAAAVIGLWRPASTMNSTSGEHSPIVSGNQGAVTIGK